MIKIAFMYDFDRTLSPKDMQEYGFIDKLNMNPSDFWEKSTALSDGHQMDHILAYMYMMIREAGNCNFDVTRELLNNLGKQVDLFPGVETWFKRMNDAGLERGLKIEHYIISSGLKEIIEGTSIYNEFNEVYACEFLYDSEGRAIWPKQAINFTTKTQFIFRINKGAKDVTDIKALNKFVSYHDREIPFEHMIYIGDGITDIPSMKVVKVNGGHSIAVFQEGEKETVIDLVKDKRVNFCAPANYEVGSHIEKLCLSILDEIAISIQQRTLREKIQF